MALLPQAGFQHRCTGTAGQAEPLTEAQGPGATWLCHRSHDSGPARTTTWNSPKKVPMLWAQVVARINRVTTEQVVNRHVLHSPPFVSRLKRFPESVKSRTGFVTELMSCPAIWCSKLQPCIATQTWGLCPHVFSWRETIGNTPRCATKQLEP